MELNENIMQIVVRHLNNEASKNEEADLASWLQANPVNQQEFDAYVKIWKDSSDVMLNHDFNAERAWENLDKTLQPSAVAPPGKKTTLFTLKRIAVAAAIILFVTAGALYLFNLNTKSSWKSFSALRYNEQIKLPDGSVVILRKGSTLRYSNKSGNKDRLAELEGEAYFEIARNEQGSFKVTTSHAVVEVLGTSFLVRNTKSFDQVVVTSGKVRFAELKNNSHQIILTKHQKAELANKMFTQDTVLNTNYMGWQNGKLTFQNIPLVQVAEDVGHLYKVQVKLAPEVQKDAGLIKITAEFDQETLQQVLDEIQLTTGLKITNEDGVVIIGE